MFRTARGLLVIVALAFVAALSNYLWTLGRAAEAFTPYPFLMEPLGQGLGRRLLPRFAVIATGLFLLPYVVASLLLFLADARTEMAPRLWRRTGGAARRIRDLTGFTFSLFAASLAAVFSGALPFTICTLGEALVRVSSRIVDSPIYATSAMAYRHVS